MRKQEKKSMEEDILFLRNGVHLSPETMFLSAALTRMGLGWCQELGLRWPTLPD